MLSVRVKYYGPTENRPARVVAVNPDRKRFTVFYIGPQSFDFCAAEFVKKHFKGLKIGHYVEYKEFRYYKMELIEE